MRNFNVTSSLLKRGTVTGTNTSHSEVFTAEISSERAVGTNSFDATTDRSVD